MKTKDIEILLEKFYAGESSVDEEKKIAEFLFSEDLPEKFLPDRKVFEALNENGMDVPSDSSQKIESLIDSFSEETSSRRPKIRSIKYWTVGIAASLALIFAVNMFQKSNKEETTLLVDTYETSDEAYKATMEALQLFSENFSKGTQAVEKANTKFQKAQDIINKSTK